MSVIEEKNIIFFVVDLVNFVDLIKYFVKIYLDFYKCYIN